MPPRAPATALMRVALVKHSAVGRHGGTRLLFRLAHELRALGIDAPIVLHDFDGAAAFPEMTAGLDIRYRRRVRFRGPQSLARMLLEQESDSRRLADLVPRDADVLHVHEWRGLRAAALAKRARRLVWSCNDPSPWDFRAARGAGIGRLAGRGLAVIDRAYGVHAVDRMLVLSEQARSVMSASTGIDPAVTRCGVDVVPLPSREEARRALGLGAGLIVLGVGVLIPRRRFEDLIAALPRVPELDAVIVGSDEMDPAYARSLRDIAAGQGVDGRVRFVTRPPDDDRLRSYYAAADVFVFPNEGQTWGLAVTEAMAAGVPCVVSTGSGVHEVLTDGRTALLVPPRSPIALADALGRLARDASLREAVGREGRRHVETHLTWRSFALAVREHYDTANTPTSSGSTAAP